MMTPKTTNHAFDRISQEYDVQALHSEVMHLISDNPDVCARVDAYNALDRAMARGTVAGKLESLRALKTELEAPVVARDDYDAH